MRRTSLAEFRCSVARTVDVIGEWWTPLIIRDAFYGRRRFEDFQRSLGLARNVLATRLERLVEAGIMERSATRSIRPETSTCSPKRGVTCSRSSQR